MFYLNKQIFNMLLVFSFFICVFNFFYVNAEYINQNKSIENESVQIKSRKKTFLKRICILYGNCQMNAVTYYLKVNYPHLYEYHMYWNYVLLKNPSELPLDLFKKADLFIYQPLKGHGIADTAYIKANYISKKCKCISFPYIYFNGYFPDYVHDINYARTVSKQYPSGIFYTGHQKIIDFICNGDSPNKIVEKCMSPELFSEEYIRQNYQKTIRILREHEIDTDVKIASFIESNYKKARLFHTINHPTNIILKEVLKQIISILKWDSTTVDNNPLFDHEILKEGGFTDIIYPSVSQNLGLEFDTSTGFCHDEEVGVIRFVDDYIKYLYPEYYNSFL